MKSRSISCVCLIVCLFLSPSIFADVVINEFSYDPSDEGEEGGALREFIELYNPGSETVDLTGYSFSAGIQYTFPDGSTLAPNSYLVVARVPTLWMWWNQPFTVLGPYEGKLSNGGEKIALQRQNGSIVEQFAYDDDIPWPRGADGYGPTLERISADLAADDFHSWRASLSTGGTPGYPNSVYGTLPRPVIRGHQTWPSHPQSSDPVTIQIGLDSPELISTAFLHWETNTKTIPDGLVNADDTWRLWKGRTAPSANLEWTASNFDDSSWTTAPGGFGYGDLDQVNTVLSDMQGNYSTVYIRHAFTVSDPASLGTLSLTVYYDDGFVCYINGVEVTRSYVADPYSYASLATGSHESETSETFELGSASSLLQTGENTIALVGMNNSLAGSSDFVLAAHLLATNSMEGNQRIPMTYASEWIGGATYEATVPAQTNQTLVRYNVELELTTGETLILPHEGERRPFESYFVYDNDIPTQLPIMWLFSNQITHLTQKAQAFSAVVVKPLGSDPVQVFDGASVISSRTGQKVKFLKGEEYRQDRTLNLSLESPPEGTTAGAQSPHVEHISYQLFHDFGVLTPRCDWYRVIENGMHYQRIATEQPNEQFLEINGRNSDGNLYKIAYNEPNGYSKKNNLDEGDEDFVELFQHVNMYNTTTLSKDLRSYLAIDEVMGYEVAMFLLSHWDGIKNNIFLYHSPDDPYRWEIIPWDVDKTFGYTDSDPMYWEMPIDFYLTGEAPGSPELTGRSLIGPISRPFHMDHELNQDFINHVATALDGLFSLERVGGMIDDDQDLLLADLQSIEEYTGTTNDARRDQINTSYETMRYFMEMRHQFLRTQLPTDFTIARTLPVTEYHAGDTISGVKLTLSALPGKTVEAQVLETIPSSLAVAQIQTNFGQATLDGNTITWNVSGLTGAAELTYDLIVPGTNPPVIATIAGTISLGDIVYAIPDSTMKYLPDNVSSLGSDWVIGSAGVWTIIDGVLNCYADTGNDPKHVWVNREFDTGDYTVQADVRMIDWTDTDLARAGIAVRVNPFDGERALNLLFHEDTGSVDMLNDLVSWGTQGNYSWEIGQWYTMILTASGSLLEGQIFKKGSNESPFIISWNDFALSLRSPGYPGLTGSSLVGLTSQYDNFQVIVNDQVVFIDNFDRSTSISDWQVY